MKIWKMLNLQRQLFSCLVSKSNGGMSRVVKDCDYVPISLLSPRRARMEGLEFSILMQIDQSNIPQFCALQPLSSSPSGLDFLTEKILGQSLLSFSSLSPFD